MTKRQVQVAKRNTLKRIAGIWHYRYRPKHFTNQGARTYRMKRRKTKEIFTGVEKRKGAGTRPLVKTGETERKAKARTIRGTFRKATVSMPVGHINRYRPKGFLPGQLRFELIKVPKQEEKELARDAQQALRSQFTRGRSGITVQRFDYPTG